MTQIIPAILTDNIQSARRLLEKYFGITDWVQIDIMDGKFVPSKSIAVKELFGLRHQFNLDFHLMVEAPETYIADCITAGAKRIIFQLESTINPAELLQQIVDQGVAAGIALRPETPLEALAPYLDQVAFVLLLSVNPGKQGQSFLPGSLDRIKTLRQLAPKIKIEADGGISLDNIKAVAAAGADYIVVGSAISAASNPAQAFNDLKQQLS